MAWSKKARKARQLGRTPNWMKQDPWLQGGDAHYAGKLETDNPHEPGTDDHTDWLRGFQEMEAQDPRKKDDVPVEGEKRGGRLDKRSRRKR